MKVYYDLHIHSALSPCAEAEMTPNNIVNMALLKGLDAIALTDHNAADNIPAVEKLARKAGICFLPGIEVTTAEEVHVLGLFAKAEQAQRFGELVYAALPDIPAEPLLFGDQHILNEEDEVTGVKEKLLLSATNLSIDECCTLIAEHGGIYVPAHINREANSLLANLGFFPPQIHFPVVEVWEHGAPVPDITARVLHSSDAHTLGQLAEREHCIEVENDTAASLLHSLQNR